MSRLGGGQTPHSLAIQRGGMDRACLPRNGSILATPTESGKYANGASLGESPHIDDAPLQIVSGYLEIVAQKHQRHLQLVEIADPCVDVD